MKSRGGQVDNHHGRYMTNANEAKSSNRSRRIPKQREEAAEDVFGLLANFGFQSGTSKKC